MPKITPGNGLDVSRRAKARRRFLSDNLGEIDCRVLEIGALDNPTFLKSEGEIYFADFFTQRESVDRHKANAAHSWQKIVSVDYVLRDRPLSEAITLSGDLIIANHVIEHIPDPIRWFQELHAVSAPGGKLFLSIPDRRYTFDYFKPVTDAVDWLRAHDEQLMKPSYYQILRHLYYHTSLTQEDAWAGNFPADHLHRISMPEAVKKAESLAAEYTDVHCSIFTHDSFLTLMGGLDDTGLIPWSITRLEDVQPGENELRVLLHRR